jgi:MoaA/NifB/PqqE/SkfB family radical SAM enzyme
MIQATGNSLSVSPFRPQDYVEQTVHFRCNLACKHCMILESMHWLKPADEAEFEALLDENRRQHKWQGLILTGSEVTLRKDLPDLASRATAAGFQHVRIQTHGMRLASPQYCQQLVDAGIDEFFISLTADSPETHDLITEVPGSFEKTVQGLQNLQQFDHVRVMTNTVVTRLSYQSLVGVVELLKPLRNLVEMDFWCYWPMAEEGDAELLVSHLDVAPHLRRAIRLARSYGRWVEVKNFPHCLLGSESDALRNDQPELRIDPRFWNEFNRNGFHQCAYRDVCGSQQCLGLNTAYVNQFGWHEDGLSPMPRTC